MTETYEAEIEVLDERVTVTFERPDVITRSRLIGEMPQNFRDIVEEADDPEDVDNLGLGALETADLEWMHKVISECTDIPEEVVDDLPVETFMKMLEPAVDMVVDNPPDEVRIDQPEDSEGTVAEVRERI